MTAEDAAKASACRVIRVLRLAGGGLATSTLPDIRPKRLGCRMVA
jgi:hypothetical protein